mmetsp:Transcript_50836/g.115630  ORF Transcript_50836/g.115630 Transcript_50836/m.115630 type:complete len:405 (-) Transcript_50836:181-1395(-)
MESAIKTFLESSLGDYVEGLDQIESMSLGQPITLRGLRMKTKQINEDLAESESPVTVTSGIVGLITLSPSIWGNVSVTVNDVQLEMSFDPVKAMKYAWERAKGGDEAKVADDEETDTDAQVPLEVQKRLGLGVPPRPLGPAPPGCFMFGDKQLGPDDGPFFCSKHNTSALRKKRIEGRLVNCQGCGAALNTSYEEFSFCPVCSNRQHKCMICGGEEADGAVPRDLPVSPARGDLNGAPQAPDPPHGHGSYGPMPDVLSRAAQDTPASKPPSPQRPGTAETQPADPWTAGIPPRPGSETTSESRPVPPRPASFGRFGSGYPGSFSNSNMPGRPQQSSLYPGQSVPAPRYQAPPPPPLAPSPFGAVPTPGLPVRMQSATHDAYAWGGSVGTGPWAQPVPRWGSSRR